MAERSTPRPIDPDAQRVGRVLRAVRQEQQRTQEEVASKLPIGEGAYAAWEAGRSRFTLPELPSVAAALGVDVSYLSRRLGLCGDASDAEAFFLESFGPEFGPLMIQVAQKLPSLDPERRGFLRHALKSV